MAIFQDWVLILIGEHIRTTPLYEADEEVFERVALGSELYDKLLQRDSMSSTLFHRSLLHLGNEIHAIRPLSEDRFIGWITL